MKLLRNVVSNTYKDRKYPGRFDREYQVEQIEEGEALNDTEMDLIKMKRWQKQQVVKPKTKGLTAAELDGLKGLSVEEQMKRLNNDFNFYAM